jgi:hypothetical protein
MRIRNRDSRKKTKRTKEIITEKIYPNEGSARDEYL